MDSSRRTADGRFDFANGQWVRLKFWISKACGKYLKETRLSKDQQIVEVVDGYEVTTAIVDGLKLKRWLQSYATGPARL